MKGFVCFSFGRHSAAFRWTAVLIVLFGISTRALCGDIYAAVKADDADAVDALLKENPGLVASTNYYANDLGWTPLHVAAIFDRKEVVKVLLANKANIEAKDRLGHTPLEQGAMRGSKAVVALLLANKANINARDISKDTPLMVAAVNNQKEIVELLLSKGADINARNVAGWTALRFAIERGNKEVADMLREHASSE